MTFSGLDSAPQTISVSYTGANSLSTPNICDGFFVSSDEDVATVSSSGVVTPVGKGNCEITFYSYDAGRTSTTSVTVNSNPSLSGRIVAMDSPKYDTGTSPVAGAKITIGDTTVVTDENGEFKFDSVPASSKLTAVVTYETGVTRTVNITMQTDNKVLADIPIITVDYANDGYINAKDYACMKRSGASEEQFTRFDNFLSANGYATGFYPNLNL
jgi:hypothetical protein